MTWNDSTNEKRVVYVNDVAFLSSYGCSYGVGPFIRVRRINSLNWIKGCRRCGRRRFGGHFRSSFAKMKNGFARTRTGDLQMSTVRTTPFRRAFSFLIFKNEEWLRPDSNRRPSVC
ncbi:hypothetical protein HAX54_016730 [Datura stramonium]|uniref:Uncharacterized protein n=1 Tax=Datura stramonium TaxID=4076 RepID=A0ABS8UJG7_DATST|nr:hypothetical protein [Datura stramonium]